MGRTYKLTLYRTVAVILVISLSIAFGFAYNSICTKLEKKQYPIPAQYAEYIKTYSEKYGVPEQIILAVIKTESGFESDAVSSAGAVGIMQIMPKTFDWITRDILSENLDTGLLYSPETNIKYGTYLLSYLYNEYGIWETCFAAYNAGIGNVNEWLNNPDYVDSNGLLKVIPNSETSAYVKKVSKAIDMYQKLYFEA